MHLKTVTDENIRHFNELVMMFKQLCEDFKKSESIEEREELLEKPVSYAFGRSTNSDSPLGTAQRALAFRTQPLQQRP